MITCYCDGGCHNNQDPNARRAYGSFKVGDMPIVTRQFGNRTNNEAEYMSLINCLSRLKTLGIVRAEICTDSQLIVGHLTKGWRITAPHLVPLFNMARELLGEHVLRKVDRNEIVAVLGH